MSPCHIRKLTAQGLAPVDYTAESLAEAAQYEPHAGVYTVTNTFNTFQVLKFDAHLDRLEDSARQAHIPLQLDRPKLRQALHLMIREAGFGDVRFRVTVPADDPETFILSLEPFKPLSPELIASGVRCQTSAVIRSNPEAKTTDWMHDRTSIEAALPPGVYTALLVDEQGTILEGINSNFYAVLRRELRTAGAGVLPGIAQQIVFEVAPAILPVNREAVTVTQISSLNEAFITSSSRGVLPVVAINDIQIGEGRPGPYTMSIRHAYLAWMDTHLEDL
ncbi:MAG: hypothetical protein GYB67_05880 [Chloroflexi bacterium]|nr:hypothetical protein [Chloroflexota bacterium]